jgi:hypothetical protein
MILNNTRQIRAEDFEQEMQRAISQLGSILNPFMQQILELSNNRIDFENRVESIKTIDIKVDSKGIPLLNNNFNVEKQGIRGTQVISAFNLDNPSGYPISQPFINYTPISGTTVKINSITGILPDQTYRLTIIIY